MIFRIIQVEIDMIGNGISNRQNETKNIDSLAAQRQLYFEAKRMTFYQFILCVLIPITLPVLKKVSANNVNQLAFISIFAILIVVINNFYFEKQVKSQRAKAAKIQELFDTDVLEINWNSQLCGSKEILHNGLKKKAEKYKKRNKTVENLLNWYPQEYSKVDISAGRIMCQKANITWDNEVRMAFKYFLIIVLIASSIFIILYSIIENNSFSETLIAIIAPLFPIWYYVFKRYCENNDTIMRNEKMHGIMEVVWDQVMKGNSTNADLAAASRKLQDSIFNYRSNALMIWDWFYFFKREKQESNMNEVAKCIVEEFNKAKS